MKLLRTVDLGGYFIQKYKSDVPVKTVIFIRNLQNLGFNVEYVIVHESVERDMKSDLDGELFSTDDFMSQFNRINKMARDASYEMKIIYNELSAYLCVAENSDTIAVTTVDRDLDLRSLLTKVMDYANE